MRCIVFVAADASHVSSGSELKRYLSIEHRYRHSTDDIPPFIGVKSDGGLYDIEYTLEMDMKFCDERLLF
jgi:hypothetical protein